MQVAIHQFVHTLQYGDAISGEAIALQRLMTRRGISSKIYSVHAHEKVADLITPYVRCEREIAAELLAGIKVAVILHHSIASPLNTLFMKLHGVVKFMIYHNLTPVHWFQSYNPRVVKDLEHGRDELPLLLEYPDVILADSIFNAHELAALGCKNVEVFPLVFDTEKWQQPANPGIASALTKHGGKNILTVGRIAPNKCVEDIIKPFYFYHHKINRKSRLWIVGVDTDTEIYSFELKRLVQELRLKEAVTFVGSVSDGELRAFYENSDVYMAMSEHEGFCMPIVEAMHFCVPIIAFNSCAVPETLGGAGVLLQDKSPAVIAELMHVVATDLDLRRSLQELGKKRVADFSIENFSLQFDSKILKRVTSAEHSPREISGLEQKSVVG